MSEPRNTAVIRRSRSAVETEAVAAAWAETLKAGDVVLLSGELGAGKTTFVRGACRALGIGADVTSPTFTIGQRYPGPVRIAHLDLYRIADLEDEDPELLDHYLAADTIAFVEWPDGAETAIAALGRRVRRVSLAHAGGDSRRLQLDGE